MKPTRFLGIDPGRTGAFGLIEADGIQVFDMPDCGKHRGVDLYPTCEILRQIPVDGTEVALEWNTGRPNEVPDFAFRFGLQSGQIDALLFASGFNISHVSSNAWTGRLGLPGKSWAGAVEQREALLVAAYPYAAGLLRGPKGGLLDGRIDALCIAEYLRRGHGTLTGHKGGRRPVVFRGLDPNPLGDWMRQLDVPHDEIK